MTYKECCKMEDKSKEILRPFIESISESYEFTDDLERQRTIGDLIMTGKGGRKYNIEMKCAEDNRHKNFYLEVWSNCRFERRRPGWMATSTCDYLWWHSIKEGDLYSIDFPKLFKWAWQDKHIYEHRVKPQWKNKEENITLGACVPITTIKEQVGYRLISNIESVRTLQYLS